ncbi:MAG TPA: hypothetical protein VMV69_03690 [Pirellulales bacterium]|nr:hypothetical protein [Pirellulales bacterium]
MDIRAIRFIRAVGTPDAADFRPAGSICELPAVEAMAFVTSNAAEWHTPRRYVPSNGEFLSRFDPLHLRG